MGLELRAGFTAWGKEKELGVDDVGANLIREVGFTYGWWTDWIYIF